MEFIRGNLHDLSLVERDVLRCFRQARRENRSPHIKELRDSLGCRHSGHIPGLVISLIKKGYLRDMIPSAEIVPLPARGAMQEVGHG